MIAVGQSIGSYTITAKLGEGGMGVVYLAEHVVIGRKVAMKVIHPELSRNQEVVSRFITEAKSVNQIGHDHVVDISDFGTTPEGDSYFIMEFLQGESLADRLKRERVLQPARALPIAAQVADALAASHDHGIIHRDLKPENIFLINKGGSADFVKVLDFGLAKLTLGEEKATHKTRTGSVMGTPYYMAPEQCEGRANIDHRADIYSLGVIVFEMLTGSVPFSGEGYGEIIVKHITAPRPQARSLNPQLLVAHEAILQRALRIAREERFSTMTEFRIAMDDPEGYNAQAPVFTSGGMPNLSGAMPSLRADEAVSGQVVFGGGPASSMSRALPSPTTFRPAPDDRHDELAPARSRKGLVVGVLLAAAVAGAGAWFVGVRPTSQTPASSTAAEITPAPSPTAGQPETVTVALRSDPPGARVVRQADGQLLGTTPVDVPYPRGTEPVQVVFQKDSFEDKELVLVPREETALTASLIALQTSGSGEPGVRPEQGAGRGSDTAGDKGGQKPEAKVVRAPPRPRPAAAKPAKKPAAGPPPPDRDGVLPLNF